MLTYAELTQHIVPGPQSISYFIPMILLPTALLIPRTTLSRWQNTCIFMPLIGVSTAHAWIQMRGVDVISIDVLLWSLYLLALKDPWNDFRYIGLSRELERVRIRDTSMHQPANGAGAGMAFPSAPVERLSWVGRLLVSIRLHGWTIGQRSHDERDASKRPVMSRIAFTRHALISFARGYLVLDFTRAYQSYDPYFTDLSTSVYSPLPLHIGYVPPRLFRSMVMGAQAWALLSQLVHLPCLILVGLNAVRHLPEDWSPHTWHPLFGDAYVILSRGIRGFWGQYWHQAMRAFTSAPGETVAGFLRLKQRNIIRYVIITTIAFGLSGIIHMGLVPPEPLHATMDANDIRLQIAIFFWVQPFAIITETCAVRLVSCFVSWNFFDQGIGSVLRMAINGTLFMLWFAVCLSTLGEALRQLGYWRVWPVPISIWRGLIGEGWVTW